MSDVQVIVEKLNGAPFNHDLTLVSLSEKAPHELLELLSDIFSKISPKHTRVNVPSEGAMEPAAVRLLDFLRIVKYKPDMEMMAFRESLAAGAKDVVYAVLKWILPQWKQLVKRAFVGYYLSFPEMPEDMMLDPDVLMLREEVAAHQQEFVELHKQFEMVKSMDRDPQALKQRIKQGEEEKSRLRAMIQRVSQKVENVPNRQEVHAACTELRRQQDERAALEVQVIGQRQALEYAQSENQRMGKQLRDLTSGGSGGSHKRLLATMAEEANTLRTKVTNSLPREMEMKEQRLALIREVLGGGPSSESELQRYQQRLNQLRGDVQSIADRRTTREKQRAGDPGMLQLRQAQQMANMVKKRKEEVLARLERLKEKKLALGGGRESEDGVGEAEVNEDEWRAKYDSVRARLPMYKQMKQEISDLEAELLVLARTEDILQQRERAAVEVAEKMGLSGLAEDGDRFDPISEEFAECTSIDDVKRRLADSSVKLKERKGQLAPRIRELRGARQDFQNLEGDHEEKKRAYDSAMRDIESTVARLESEVVDKQTATTDLHRTYHLLGCKMHMLDNDIRRFIGTDAAAIKEKYASAIEEAEAESRQLKDRQRRIKESYGAGMNQKEMMKDLARLLELKVNIYQGGNGGVVGPEMDESTAQSFQTATGNVMVL